MITPTEPNLMQLKIDVATITANQKNFASNHELLQKNISGLVEQVRETNKLVSNNSNQITRLLTLYETQLMPAIRTAPSVQNPLITGGIVGVIAATALILAQVIMELV